MTNQSGWGASFAAASTRAMSFYDDIMVPRWFDPWARKLLDTVKLETGQAVLDVACGPGTVTRLAAQRVGPGGSVTGCDLSPAMLEIARSKSSLEASAPIEYLECPADSLAVPDSAFDVVTCQQGLQFFPDREAALSEMRRALQPGGRVGISVWCAIEDCPPFMALATALEEVLGAGVAEAYARGPFGLADSAALVELAYAGGFTDVDVRRYELPIVFDGGPGQLLLTLRATPVAQTLAQLSEQAHAKLASAVEARCRHFTVDGVVRSQTASHIVTATVDKN